MWQHMFCVSVMCAVWRRELQLNIAVFINILNILRIE